MFVPEQLQVDKPHTAKLMYKGYHAEQNNIDLRGCQHLATADWPNLTQLSLGTNHIIQGQTILVMEDANSWQQPIGKTSLI